MNASMRGQTMLILYDPATEAFTYLSDMSVLGDGFDHRPLWQILREDGVTCADTVDTMRGKVAELIEAGVPQACEVEVRMRDRTRGCRKYRAGFIYAAKNMPVTITLTDIDASACCDGMDDQTGLLTRRAFCQQVDAALQNDPEGAKNGGYAVMYLDLLRFKAVSDLLGRARSGQLLDFVAEVIRKETTAPECACCVENDHFIIFLRTGEDRPEALLSRLHNELQHQRLPMEITFNAGIYVTSGTDLSADAMIDRAALAQSSIKGRYDVRSVHFTEKMRAALLSEQEIEGLMASALEERQFVVWFQPQYNHANGMLIGAEALVRWQHPERGLIPPADFIPIFEKNGFITQMDLYVFEAACAFLKKCMDARWALVPVSTNFSRYDIFLPDFVDRLEKIRARYGVPTKYLRVELTESAMIDVTGYVNEVIGRLHQVGYIVEMDDFGSGYSSLNVLKDIDLDIIKLDMQFLSDATGANRGGTILSSIIRMAKWLDLPVIAEGVETVEQADFLRSIGCDHIQGYLYSRPLPEEQYMQLVSSGRIGATVPQMDLIKTLNAFNFWEPTSQETLIFSNYVGGAAIFDYHQGKVEILRVNKKYLQELSMNLSEKEIIESDPLAAMSEADRAKFVAMLEKAIETMEEQECETWRDISSSCCGDERFCIRSNVQVIGVSGDRYLFHGMIRNVTAEKLYYGEVLENERRFKVASEQVNIYFWEYSILTHEMRPCFRCMRDLNLPPLVTNYPEPLIEAGIFPPEIADDYRAYMKHIDAGETMPETVVPLTMDRVPFRVRYTTEFDENGHPVKAYGSAALEVGK